MSDLISTTNSLLALDNAIEIARHFGAAVSLVHVIPLVVQFGEVPIPVELYEEQEKAARAKLGEIVRQKLNGVEHESVVYTGDVVGSVLQAMRKFEPDLLVMATHGRSGTEGTSVSRAAWPRGWCAKQAARC